MKKEDKEKINLKSNLYSKQNIEIENFKTTNVNILLNRVRLDKKKTFKKKIIFSFILVSIITSIIFFVV